MNESIKQCKYPSRWKMEQLTPLFKKNDELSKENYRPVTVLPALNNVFEKLLASQPDQLYSEILSDYISRYLKDMFRLRSSTYFLRGHNILCLPKPSTTCYGLNSFSYLAATSWNSLPDHYQTISDFTSFRPLISTGNNNLLERAGTANLSTS